MGCERMEEVVVGQVVSPGRAVWCVARTIYLLLSVGVYEPLREMKTGKSC